MKDFTTEVLSPLDVELDPHNPRLSAGKRGATQAELLKVLVDAFKVEDVAVSIATSGYLPFEALVGFRRGPKVVVREGNRRIAALKVLLKPELAPPEMSTRFAELAQSMNPGDVASIQKVPVLVFENEDDASVEAYLGFRHVTGTLEWDPEQRANFVAELIDDHGWSFKEIADRIGSYPKIVERAYVAYRVLEQAKELDGGARVKIGVLTRALQASGIANYVGVEYRGNPSDDRSPVPAARIERLGRLVKWVFGTDSVGPLFSDSRKLTDLGKVLATEEGSAYLENSANPDLEVALKRSGSSRDMVLHGLLGASVKIEEIIAFVSEFAEDKKIADAAVTCAKRVGQLGRDIPQVAATLRESLKPTKVSASKPAKAKRTKRG